MIQPPIKIRIGFLKRGDGSWTAAYRLAFFVVMLGKMCVLEDNVWKGMNLLKRKC